MAIIIHLNNGESLRCEKPARGENMVTLAKQISECALVNAVDCDVDGPSDEIERYENGRCIGFLYDQIG
jgi:hypothetical protein